MKDFIHIDPFSEEEWPRLKCTKTAVYIGPVWQKVFISIFVGLISQWQIGFSVIKITASIANIDLYGEEG